jgi:hypothetical protein
LRRAVDRVLAWIRVGMVAAFLTGGPLAAIGAGNWMYHAAVAESRAQAAQRHSVRAVLLEATPAAVFTMAATHWASQTWALARWQGTPAVPHTGEVLVAAGLRAGSAVTVWLDASGKLTAPPLQSGQITDRTVAAAAMMPAALALTLLAVLWLAHRIGDRRRLAAWDAAWSMVGPHWTRRGP